MKKIETFEEEEYSKFMYYKSVDEDDEGCYFDTRY